MNRCKHLVRSNAVEECLAEITESLNRGILCVGQHILPYKQATRTISFLGTVVMTTIRMSVFSLSGNKNRIEILLA